MQTILPLATDLVAHVFPYDQLLLWPNKATAICCTPNAYLTLAREGEGADEPKRRRSRTAYDA